MSRIEKQPVVIPEAVEVNIVDAENLFTVKGPKGELSLDLINDISVSLLEAVSYTHLTLPTKRIV